MKTATGPGAECTHVTVFWPMKSCRQMSPGDRSKNNKKKLFSLFSDNNHSPFITFVYIYIYIYIYIYMRTFRLVIHSCGESECVSKWIRQANRQSLVELGFLVWLVKRRQRKRPSNVQTANCGRITNALVRDWRRMNWPTTALPVTNLFVLHVSVDNLDIRLTSPGVWTGMCQFHTVTSTCLPTYFQISLTACGNKMAYRFTTFS